MKQNQKYKQSAIHYLITIYKKITHKTVGLALAKKKFACKLTSVVSQKKYDTRFFFFFFFVCRNFFFS